MAKANIILVIKKSSETGLYDIQYLLNGKQLKNKVIKALDRSNAWFKALEKKSELEKQGFNVRIKD